MEKWNFQVNNSPKRVSKKLESSLRGTDKFALKTKSDNRNNVKFKLRKRLLLPFEISTQNNIIVNGELLKTDSDNVTAIKIFFTQHPLTILLIYGHIALGLGFLIGMFLNISSNTYMYLIGGILLAIGGLFKLHYQKDFRKNVQEYKTLISNILEI